MKIEISDVSSVVIAHDLLNYLKENFVLETCGTPDDMILERMSEIIKEKVNNCLSEFNNRDVIL